MDTVRTTQLEWLTFISKIATSELHRLARTESLYPDLPVQNDMANHPTIRYLSPETQFEVWRLNG